VILEIKKSLCPHKLFLIKSFSYFLLCPEGLGVGRLLPLPLPYGLPLVLGPFSGLETLFAISLS
jgi:hypothetical protein